MTSRPWKIMVVDDSDLVRDLVQLCLEDCGYEVVVLANQMEFARALNRERPDLVLMDVNMPAIQGNTIVELVRQYGLHRCPILLHSDLPAEELETLVQSSGADGYIHKTGDPEELERRIRPYLVDPGATR